MNLPHPYYRTLPVLSHGSFFSYENPTDSTHLTSYLMRTAYVCRRINSTALGVVGLSLCYQPAHISMSVRLPFSLLHVRQRSKKLFVVLAVYPQSSSGLLGIFLGFKGLT